MGSQRVARPSLERGMEAASGKKIFFSPSSVADVALMARSLHESKQKIHCTRTKGPWSRQID